MLWPFRLPFQITLCVALAIVLAAPLVAQARGKQPGRVLAWCVVVVIISFVPSCTAIMWTIDGVRFGVFHYPDFAAVKDDRVERYLPPTSREIVINKYPQGFVARFKIEREQLDRWFDQIWERYGDKSTIRRGELRSFVESPQNEFDDELQLETDRYLGDWIDYVSPMADNGAGFELWYNNDASVAYQKSGYW